MKRIENRLFLHFFYKSNIDIISNIGDEAILAEHARILENYRLLKNSAYLLKTKDVSKEKLWGAGS